MPEWLPTRRTARKSAAVPATIESEPPARRRAAWGVQSFSERRKRVVRSAAEIAAVRQGLEAAQEKRQQEEGDEKYRAPIAGELVAFIRAIRVFIREFTRVFIRVFNSIRLFL